MPCTPALSTSQSGVHVEAETMNPLQSQGADDKSPGKRRELGCYPLPQSSTQAPAGRDPAVGQKALITVKLMESKVHLWSQLGPVSLHKHARMCDFTCLSMQSRCLSKNVGVSSGYMCLSMHVRMRKGTRGNVYAKVQTGCMCWSIHVCVLNGCICV